MYDQSKLSELIRFARVDAGSTVIDVYQGDGDWTRLFSDIVGPADESHSFVPGEVAHFKRSGSAACGRLRRSQAEENVQAVSADLRGDPEATSQQMSCRCTSTTIALIQAKKADGGQFNRAVYERLKLRWPLRHRRSHCPRRVGHDRHPVAASIGTPTSVREEVEAAGFVLDAESTMLANNDDKHSTKVFDPSIKGETDRFAYRFARP